MTLMCEDIAAWCGQYGGATVRVFLTGTDVAFTDSGTLFGDRSFDVYDGEWCCDLPSPLDPDFVPQGAVWAREIVPFGAGRSSRVVNYFTVPITGGPYDVAANLTDPPGEVASSALAMHEAQHLGDGVHGVIEHVWSEDGWGAFDRISITSHPPTVFNLTVTGDAGVVVGVGASGNHREMLALEGSMARDSVFKTLFGPPANWAATNAQVGHIHRAREVSPGLWEGIAVWTAIVGGDMAVLNVRAVRWDGTTLWQSDGPLASAADLSSIDRTLALVNKSRFTAFGLWFNEVGVMPQDAYGLVTGDRVTVDSQDATFDETNVALTGVGPAVGTVQYGETTTLSASALAIDRGTVTPSQNQKRWCPFWMATRIRGGDETSLTVEYKRWRPEDPEPDWSSARVQRPTVLPNVGVPTIPTERGLTGLWLAHYFNGSGQTIGGIEFENLD